ncbi:murein DD-endopeptidase MepM/ murein hydrolase activator NlpD [Agromyces hippuratus]|uniref:Murein DD-endopeptidase MepM/ murein hydrolase activator NlpD n=1 Tax=Agromyces hippuratus TaxID=286438 RepID=A0A852WS37_9MICO|nr:M23 family metallopeptidase [Agromyces hippuratus]NYG21052.1 murein DD-endopeptidase MepM/ murein hydrolase activator NlpD [Agromyces hippuratus]
MYRTTDRTPADGVRTSPVPAEAQAARSSGRRRTTQRLVAVVAIIAAALVGPVVAPQQSAFAASYPTWDELQAAKADTAAGAAAVEQITALIAELEVNVQVTRAEAERRTDELFVAQQQYDEAVLRAEQIQAQADASAAEALSAETNAGQVAAQLYRSGGGGDVGVNLFLDAGDAKATDELLSKLGSMEKMVERTSNIYDRAQEKKNTAEALSDQAEVAQAEREKLRIAAEAALVAAQEAQAAAEAALAESQTKKVELDAQLAFLKDAEAKTTAAYEEGERIRQEQERKRREEALRAGTPGTPASSGWAKPAWGGITGNYGPRSPICAGDGCSGSFHYAVDLGTGCDAPIYAANSGVVTFSGYSGTYGNFIQIDHGGGISTGYAHIRDGGRFVGSGEWVDAGQNIASSGTTGASTGCHLHFEVYRGGSRIDPEPFMADRGVYFG